MNALRRKWKCYLCMILWVFMLIIGLYKYLNSVQRTPQTLEQKAVELRSNSVLEYNVRTKRIFQLCHLPEDIQAGAEGDRSVTQHWDLLGLVITIRHGDRGPLQHSRHMEKLNCAGSTLFDSLVYKYQNFADAVEKDRTVRTYKNSFHGYQMMPDSNTRHECRLGQLTGQGVTQLLRLGELLAAAYSHWPKWALLSQHHITVFCTRYRRTFQSAMALLYGLLGDQRWHAIANIPFVESHSTMFCFEDCACPKADKLLSLVSKANKAQLLSHPAMASLLQTAASTVFTRETNQGPAHSDVFAFQDALLSYVCHNSPLPCNRRTNHCLSSQNAASIFAYGELLYHMKWSSSNWQKHSVLRAYGHIRHLVQQILKMISKQSTTDPSLAIYSAHDITLEYLNSALGLPNEVNMLRYASRMVIEVYMRQQQHNKQSRPNVHQIRLNDTIPSPAASFNDPMLKNMYYVRMLVNGRDVTRFTTFCVGRTIRIDSVTHLCSIEHMVRYVHDDYFTAFNVSNYKDACFGAAFT